MYKPVLPSKDFSRLVACLKLTDSNHDGEIANAFRGANRIIKSNGLSWDDFFQEIFAQAVEFVEQGGEKAVTIEEALNLVLEVMPTNKFRDMILGFKKQYKTKGYLSDRQREVLNDAFRKYNPKLKKQSADF